jgi:hypothetical protein
MAALGPCLVQNLTNVALGSDDRADSNIAKSLEKLNDEMEDSGLGAWLNELDEVNN